MDDCTLEKLAIKPGKLTPKFNRDLLEYHATLGSEVQQINIDCLTSDTGASYCISGSGGSRTVPLKEGAVNEVKIEVTAEDGTTRNYIIHAKRLSAKDATLSAVKVCSGQVQPEFSPDVFQYSCVVGADCQSVVVTPSVPDAKAAIVVDGEKPGEPSPLNVGDTKIDVTVTSPDGSSTQTYELTVTRKQIPMYIKLSDTELSKSLECPVSLSPVYRPITIRDSDPPHTFSAPIIDEFTKTSKQDPLNDLPLVEQWRIQNFDIDKKLSECIGAIPLIGGGMIDSTKVSELGAKLKEQSCQAKPTVHEQTFDTNVPISHTYTCRSWEKNLCVIFDESDPAKLADTAKEHLQQYYDSLPQPGWSCKFTEGESPLDHLQHAAECLASAIKLKKNNSAMHLQLGLVLEERYYAEDIVGLKKPESVDIPSFNIEAKESSKAEECAAICELRGVSASSPLSLQLKAIDQEYHHLVQSGQSGKADHVMALFAWKSKQATQEGAAAQKVEDEESPLGQAYLKYLDALSLDESRALNHYHVGRMLVVQGNYIEAVPRLQATLGWNAQLPMARFYLGFALSLQKDGPGERLAEAVTHLREAMENLLAKNISEAMKSDSLGWKPDCLQAEELLCNRNVHLLRGMIQLAKLLLQKPDIKDCILPQHVFHTAALVASQVLPTISRGDLYQQVEWVLLEAHSQLLDHLIAAKDKDTVLIVQRCQRLSALVKRSTIPEGPELMALQKRTCQRLVELTPCSSAALVMLGGVQLSEYDGDPEATNNQRLYISDLHPIEKFPPSLMTCQRLVELTPCSSAALVMLGGVQLSEYDGDPEAANAASALKDAVSSFRTSIALEGKLTAGEPMEELKGQGWWQAKVKAMEAKKAAAQPATGAAGKTAPARGGAKGASTRGAARGGAAAAKGGAAGRGRGAAAAPAKAPARGAPATRGGGRGAAAGRGGAKAEPSCKQDSKKPEPAAAAPVETPTPAPVPSNAPLNKKVHHARLGLARALSRTPDVSKDEALKVYQEVMEMAPQVHDAYIESGEILSKTDPLLAVDVYCKFPLSETPSFDDAYIVGEVVRHLMKSEKYDDPRLETNLIAMGRILGIATIETYTRVLDDKFKTDLLKKIYAGVNYKAVDDPDMLAFFKFKCWI